MDRKSVTAVVVALLFIVAFGFSRGWFTRSTTIPDLVGEKVSANQPFDQGKTTADAAK